MATPQTMLAVGYSNKRTLLKKDLDSGLWVPFDPQPPWYTSGGGSQGVVAAPDGTIFLGDESRNRLYHYDPQSGSWSIHTSGSGTTARVYAIDCYDKNNAYAIINDKGILWNGSVWTQVLDGANPGYDCWMYSPTEIWSCHYQQCWRYNGSTWTNLYSLLQAAGGSGHPYSVWGTGPNSVYVGMQNDNVYHWNGSAFSFHGDVGANCMSIWGTDDNNIYALNSNERLWRYTGSWNNLYTLYGFQASAGSPKRLMGLGPERVFCVNSDTTVCGGIYETEDGWQTSSFYQHDPPAASTQGLYDLSPWQLPDEDPPVITLITPQDGSEIAKEGGLTFKAVDADGEVTDLTATINGRLVYSLRSGYLDRDWYASAVEQIDNDEGKGYRVTLVPNRFATWRNGQSVELYVTAKDDSNNQDHATWGFVAVPRIVPRIFRYLAGEVQDVDEKDKDRS